MDTKANQLDVTIHVDDTIIVREISKGGVRVTLYGDFGQAIVIEMSKEKFEMEMLPTWEVSGDLAEYAKEIVKHLLYVFPCGDEEVITEYKQMLLANGAMVGLMKEEVQPKQVVVYVEKVIKALELPLPKEASYITALLCNSRLDKLILAD